MLKKLPLLIIVIILFFLSGCSYIYKGKVKTAVLLKTEDATNEQLIEKIKWLAKINSMRAKMDLQFEDNSYAEMGTKEEYISVDGEVVLQRPNNIFLKVGIFGTDITQMTSNGDKFHVAVLQDKSGGKYKIFLTGTNSADYSKLQNALKNDSGADSKNVNSFSNLRPQHFTDALLIRPIDPNNVYLQSTISQVEENNAQRRKEVRGYYLLDEFVKNSAGELKISRRFWFDRVGGIHLSRQQLFDNLGEIESDIIYAKLGSLNNSENYSNLPLKVTVTRPKEKYTMSLSYKNPEDVTIDKGYKSDIFELKNVWNLREVNLDDRMQQNGGSQALFKNQ